MTDNNLLPCPFCKSPAKYVGGYASCSNHNCCANDICTPRSYWNKRAEQAAQSVPVVGDAISYQFRFFKWPVGYWENCSKQAFDDLRSGYEGRLLIVKPTTAITAAELATLREKAAEADELRNRCARYAGLLFDRFGVCPECGNNDSHMESCPQNYAKVFKSPKDYAIAFAAIAQGKGE